MQSADSPTEIPNANRRRSYGRVLYNRFRYYSPELGRYISADPIGQPGGVNLYRYALNNPVNWFDPDGLIVEFGGTPAQKKKAKADYERLKKKSKTAKKICEDLEKSSETYTIVPTTGGNAYSPSTNEISYNPSSTTIGSGTKPWETRPPEVGLGHELVHARHDDEGTLGKTRADEENATTGVGPHSKDPYTDNAIRHDYGIPRRPHY